MARLVYRVVTLDNYISNEMPYADAKAMAESGETDCIRCERADGGLISRDFYNNGIFICSQSQRDYNV